MNIKNKLLNNNIVTWAALCVTLPISFIGATTIALINIAVNALIITIIKCRGAFITWYKRALFSVYKMSISCVCKLNNMSDDDRINKINSIVAAYESNNNNIKTLKNNVRLEYKNRISEYRKSSTNQMDEILDGIMV